jgi:nicotinamidase-related amidase
LVIDVQTGFFEGPSRPHEADDVVRRINIVTQLARMSGIPVIFIQSEVAGFLDYKSERWKLHRNLHVAESDIRIRKTRSNAFVETTLQETLKAIGAKSLIICGYSTELCIDATVRYASALGYKVKLVSDAHTTHDKKHLSAELIRQHHTITLSRSPTVVAVEAARVFVDD